MSTQQSAPTLRVKEVWGTVQGEGAQAGRAAVFVRLVACNMWSGREEDRERDAKRHGADCPRWCDTDFTAEGSEPLNAEQLARRVNQVAVDAFETSRRSLGENFMGNAPGLVVISGGEPLLQIGPEAVRALKGRGFHVAIETNGTVPLAGRFALALQNAFQVSSPNLITPDLIAAKDAAALRNRVCASGLPDWICCSPKQPQDQLALEYCNELKLVLPDYPPHQYDEFARRVLPSPTALGLERPALWVQPEDGERFQEAARACAATVTAKSHWRVSTQSHKTLGVK